nr:uncharacterized protein LOC109152048 [Ipomoea batatas]
MGASESTRVSHDSTRVTTKSTLATGGVSTSPVRIDGGGHCSFELVRRAGYRFSDEAVAALRAVARAVGKGDCHAPLTVLQMEGRRSKGVDGVDASTNSDPARSSMVEAGGVSNLGSPLAEATHDPVKGSSTSPRVGVEASKVAGDLVGIGLGQNDDLPEIGSSIGVNVDRPRLPVLMATATHVPTIDSTMTPKNRGEVSTGTDRDNGIGFVGGSFLDCPSTVDGSMVAVATCDVAKDSKAVPRVGPLVVAGLVCEKGSVRSLERSGSDDRRLQAKSTLVLVSMIGNEGLNVGRTLVSPRLASSSFVGLGLPVPQPVPSGDGACLDAVVASKALHGGVPSVAAGVEKGGVLVIKPTKVLSLVFRNKQRMSNKGGGHGSAKPRPFGLNIASKPGKVVVSKSLFKFQSGKKQSATKVLSVGSANANEPTFRTKPLHNVKHGKRNARAGLGPNKLQSHGFIPGQNGTNSKALHGNGRMLNMGSNYGMLNGKGFEAGTFGVAPNPSKTPNAAIRPNLSAVNEIGSATGDFNWLLSVDEKKGELSYPHRKTMTFRDCGNACDFIDVALKHFVFLNIWIKHEDFYRVVRDSSVVPVEGAPMHVLATKLNRLGKVLGVWSKEVFWGHFAMVCECDERVQKARVTAIQDGDNNSRYFHSLVKECRRKLFIHRVKNDEGQWLEDRQGIAQQAVSFFERMFTTEAGGFDLTRLDCVP